MTSRRSWVAVVMAMGLALLGCDTGGSSDRAEPDRRDDEPQEAFDDEPAPDEPAPDEPAPDEPSTDTPSRELWVAPTGRDEGRGSREDPWRTLEVALGRLEPGDVLHLAEGEYREQIRYPSLRPATPDRPIKVMAAPGANPLIRGLLWIRDADHWTFEGVNVTWDEEQNQSDHHMVKFEGGRGWQFVDSEVWGARSFAAILVANAPSSWRLADLCVHDTAPSNGVNQDHLIYVNNGPDAGPGVIETSLLFGAPNGSGVKLGGPSEDSGGASNVTVRRNTIVDAAQPILLAWGAANNVIVENILGGAGDGYGTIRGYRLDGPGNRALGNVGFDAESLVLNDDGHRGVEADDTNSFPVDPQFDEPGSCEGFRAQASFADEVGHLSASS
jgi:hypothetical protein